MDDPILREDFLILFNFTCDFPAAIELLFEVKNLPFSDPFPLNVINYVIYGWPLTYRKFLNTLVFLSYR